MTESACRRHAGRGRNWSTPYIINLLWTTTPRDRVTRRRRSFAESTSRSPSLAVFIGDAHKLPRVKSAHTRKRKSGAGSKNN